MPRVVGLESPVFDTWWRQRIASFGTVVVGWATQDGPNRTEDRVHRRTVRIRYGTWLCNRPLGARIGFIHAKTNIGNPSQRQKGE